MTVISVDLAYKKYRDIGIAELTADADGIVCEFIRPTLHGEPEPRALADYLSELCTEKQSNLLLLDGPQGWKDPGNGLTHSRVCERILNTPAKTGLPGVVKPANYTPFVAFSIHLYDCLTDLGWSRFPGKDAVLPDSSRLLVESFPLSAWRALGLRSLPAKAKTHPEDLAARLKDLTDMFPLRLSGPPNHDELQALVAGIAGLAIERGDWASCKVDGEPPFQLDGSWREGFIVNALAPSRTEVGISRQREISSEGEGAEARYSSLGQRTESHAFKIVEAKKQLEDYLLNGLAKEIIEADEAYALAEVIGKHAERINAVGFGALFRRLQLALSDRQTLSITKMFDPVHSRYRTRSIPAALELLEKHASLWSVPQPERIYQELAKAGMDSTLLRQLNYADLTYILVEHYRSTLSHLSTNLRTLRQSRDKVVAHNEAIDRTALQTPTWGEALSQVPERNRANEAPSVLNQNMIMGEGSDDFVAGYDPHRTSFDLHRLLISAGIIEGP